MVNFREKHVRLHSVKESTNLYMCFVSLGFMVGLLLVLFLPEMLPAKYFFDAERINILVLDEVKFDRNSFIVTAWIYHILGFAPLIKNNLAGIVSFAAYWLTISLVMLRYPPLLHRRGYWIFAVVLWLVGVVYLGQLSKELIAFLAIVFILPALNSQKKLAWLWISIILIAYSYFVRIYWSITLCIFLFCKLSAELIHKKKWLKLFFICIGLLIISIYIDGKFGAFESIGNVRVLTNAGRIGSSDANSIINNTCYVSGIGTFFVNWFSMLLKIMFPVHLLKFMSISKAAYVIWQCFISICLIRALFAIKKNGKNNKQIVLFILSFIATQALFEPDYGSVLKHSVALISLLYWLLFRIPTSKSREFIITKKSNLEEEGELDR
ncbi:MAG: hypothetical protein PHT79_03945 [Syntrophomonadaceae bacterium]|nr:hypothetical protein [Syntrophomonadaceae bacterium]